MRPIPERATPRRRLLGLVGGLVAVAVLLAACTSTVSGNGSPAAGAAPVGGPTASGSAEPTQGPSGDPTGLPSGGASRGPTGPGRPGDCLGGALDTSGSPLTEVILKSAPDRIPINPTASGPQPIDRLVTQSYPDFPDARQVLTSTKYQRGIQMTFSQGTPGKAGRRTEFVFVMEFQDGVGACAFAAWETKNFGLVPSPNLRLPGGLASTVSVHDTTETVECLAVKGRFVIITGALSVGARGFTLPASTALAQAQYKVL